MPKTSPLPKVPKSSKSSKSDKSNKSELSKANRSLLFSFIRYIGIGGVVFFIDIGLFQTFMHLGTHRMLATTIAYVVGVTAHFTLNKFLNFRSFERSILHQLQTYLVVVVFCWAVTVLVIEGGVRGLGMVPLWAKILAVAINIPTGFFCHRYLTFGGGIGAMLHQWRRSRRKS